MKKRAIVFSLLAITTISMTGCSFNFGREKEDVVEDTVNVITVEVDENTPNITEMSKSEILAMTSEDVKKSIETYLPSFRSIYKISENRTMTDDDWISLRNIICTQFYGDAKLGTATPEIGYEDDKNAIYYAPTKASIEAMSLAEFGAYLNGLYTYMYGDNYLSTANIDFTTYDAATLQQLKTEFLQGLS